MELTLSQAAKQSGFAKSSLLKAIRSGRLVAVRTANQATGQENDRGNGTWSIDAAELERFVEASGRSPAAAPGEPERTRPEDFRVRAEVAEKMLALLQAQLAEMTAQRDRWEVAAGRWETRFDQLKLPPANGPERLATPQSRRWWPWRRTG